MHVARFWWYDGRWDLGGTSSGGCGGCRGGESPMWGKPRPLQGLPVLIQAGTGGRSFLLLLLLRVVCWTGPAQAIDPLEERGKSDSRHILTKQRSGGRWRGHTTRKIVLGPQTMLQE